MKFILAGGLILLLVGVAMVLRAAFRKRLLWGLAVLVLPPICLLYTVQNWSDSQARNGLLLSIVGLLIAVLALYGGAGRVVSTLSHEVPNKEVQAKVRELVDKVPTAGPADEPLPNEAAAAEIVLPEGQDYDPLHSDDEYAFTDVEPLPPKEDQQIKPAAKPAVNYAYQVITTDQAKHFVGKQLKIATVQGELKEGKLIASMHDSLTVEAPLQGGTVAFEYHFADVASVLVYDVKGAVAALNQRAAEEFAPEGEAQTKVESDTRNGETAPDDVEISAASVADPNDVATQEPPPSSVSDEVASPDLNSDSIPADIEAPSPVDAAHEQELQEALLREMRSDPALATAAEETVPEPLPAAQ